MLARRWIDVFRNESMIMALADELKLLLRYPQMTACLAAIGQEEELTHRERYDPFLQAAMMETVALVSRNSVRVAREAAKAVDPFWLDVRSEEDFWLLFDNE